MEVKMLFKDYVSKLNKLLEDKPETANFTVVSSADDEGNGFNLVSYDPSVGNYNHDEKEFQSEIELNAVCIN
jgi:hypothetical protein